MWRTVQGLVRGGVSIVLTTHYIEEAEALANRVVVMAKGRQIADGTVSEIRSLVSRKRVTCATATELAAIEAWPEVSAAVREGDHLVITTADAEAVVRRLLAADRKLSDLEVRRAGLTEAFAELTQEPAIQEDAA
jgi:ABC-2 type transport system ATP-binding protein